MTSSFSTGGRWWAAAAGVAWVFVLLGAMCAGLGIWVRLQFGRVTVDQFVMNLPTAFGAGAAELGGGFAVGAVLAIVVIPVGLVTVFYLLVSRSRRALRATGWWQGTRLRGVRITAALLAILVPVWGGAILGSSVSIAQYVRSVTTPLNMADYYVAPDVASSSEKPRNLVVVYLESIEDTFADDTLFDQNMLAPVQDATQGWDSIEGLRQSAGGGWTMAGLVATQCGIPLRGAQAMLDHSARNQIGTDAESYMPGAVCLGDVLQSAGYESVFLGGADTSFAAKGQFLQDHGYDEVRGLASWLAAGETEIRRDWGLSDRRLMEQAKDEVDRLHEAGGPFHLTVLTVDTHESAYAHPYCRDEADAATEEMSAITVCSMEQVAGFIEHMDERGYLDDTAVVVMGDHVKMAAEWASFWGELEGLSDRTIFNRVWSPDGDLNLRGDVDQFSLFPTMLELAGLRLDDHRSGIGVSALAPEVPPTSAAALDPARYQELVQSRSAELYARMWAE
ncbi:MAG: sulfatase-like hydrolase/transferase [Leucobacter sp.]